MQAKIVLGSNNLGKLREFEHFLADLDSTLLAQSEFSNESVPETGLSFVENAILKARYASKVSGLPAIGDDSGLEVDALKGAPGIYSARYAGSEADMDKNIEKLLEALKGVPYEKRQARFQCLLVYLRHPEDATPIICQGTWEGYIIEQARGTQGFGYDPVFFVPTHNCTSAELELSIKNTLSHRARAVVKLLDHLQR